MAQKASVVIKIKFDLETQGVKSLLLPRNSLFLERTQIIPNFFAPTVPPIARSLNVFLRVYKRFHSLIIRRVWLAQVHNIECVVHVLSSIFDLEIEPLGHERRK